MPDDDLTPDLSVNNEEPGGRPMTDEEFYAKIDGKTKPDRPEPQGAEELGAALAASTEEGTQPPAADPDPEPEPGAGEAEGGEQPPEDPPPTDGEGEDDLPDLYPTWDQDRQRRDQEAANERKEKDGQIAALLDANAKLMARMDALTTDRDQASQATDEQSKAAEVVEEFTSEVSKLDEDSPTSEIIAALRKSAAAVKAARELGGAEAAKKVQAVESRVEALMGQLEAEKAQKARNEQAEAEEVAKGQLRSTLRDLDKQHGAHLRNEAGKRVAARLAEAGYTAEQRADVFTLELLYKEEYAKLAKEKPPRTAAAKPVQGKPPRGVSGRGGGTVVGKLKPGSVDDVAKQMDAQGMFDLPFSDHRPRRKKPG